MTSADTWWVPGGAVIADGVSKMRLRPPGHWLRFTLDVWRVPPSMNTNAVRSHWRGFHAAKKSWEDDIATLLMTQKCTEHYQRAMAGAVIRFPRRAARRDPDNFTGVLNKALGDALVARRTIPDDDAAHYHFSGVEFALQPGPAQTRIYVYLQPQES